MDLELLVIGASAAGWQGAIAAAKLDRKVGLISLRPMPTTSYIDMRDVPGGLLREVCADWPILRSGRRTAPNRPDAASWRQFANYALRIWQQEQDACRDQLLAAGGKFWTGDAYLTGPHEVSLKRPRTRLLELRSDHLLIATGTTPRNPNFATSFAPPPSPAAWILNSPTLSAEACVIGAGITGMRAACLLALWGTQVRIVDGRAVSKEAATEDTADWHAWGQELGVQFDTGEDVIGLKSRSARKLEIILESGRQIATEAVWLATGRQGRTSELKLGTAGLTTDDRGRLWCDPSYRTWVSSIYAAGDVVGFPPGLGYESELAGTIVTNLFQPARSRADMALR